MKFNSDGSLNVIEHKKKGKQDHIIMLKALKELPFSPGKKLLIEHLTGKQNSKTARLRLNRYISFGEQSGYNEQELRKLIDHLEQKKILAIKKEKGLYPVLTITEYGEEELKKQELTIDINKLEEITIINNPFKETTKITEKDQQLFLALKEFLGNFNDEQKKAVIEDNKNILCVAGAGSGKTSVLTKRIAFLSEYKGVPQNKILAITFTRKARKEMENRLQKIMPYNTIKVETFNSFCEKFLQKNGNQHYEKTVRMASRKEYFTLVLSAISKQGKTVQSMMQEYFTIRQRAGKDEKQLFFTFLYDLQTLQEKVKANKNNIEKLRKEIKTNKEHAKLAHLLLNIVEELDKEMKEEGLRDFSDQLYDAIQLMNKNPKIIPEYDHILVDEYQDVNDKQIEFLEKLNPKNLFVVGDPRQSIYGWRGSKLSHILEFPKTKENCSVIELNTNYRSTQKVLDICNMIAKKTGYKNLNSHNQEEGNTQLKYYKTDEKQASEITKEIKKYTGQKKEIFILARTNKALEIIKQHLEIHNIKYLLRTEERKRLSAEPKENEVTLATIHAVKGLEAKRIYLINANSMNFPCKASDHPVMELFNLHDKEYDSYAEELRVLYVALSRAEKDLIVSYTKSLTPFLTEAKKIFELKQIPKGKVTTKTQDTDSEAQKMKLRQWRYQKAKEKGCPAYIIFSDKTIESILEQKPSCIEDLYGIYGLAHAKIEDFGEELITELIK